MFQRLIHRLGHYLLLVLVSAALYLPNLGGPGLWDIDEGNNAEAAREMLESGNLVVPTFNYALRVDKPALLYWFQIGAYRVFGVNEFAARLPSALAALATVLLTYELGRSLSGAAAGLLAGLVLASSVLFCAAAHFANPDALLCAFTTLALLLTWLSCSRHGRLWFVPISVCEGFAVLAKGPVGLVLPLAVTLVGLAWCRRLRLFLDRRLLWGVLAFILVVAPWYAWVGSETKARFLDGFILRHNVGRYLSPMENHSGPIWYYLAVLVVGFAPWSIFLGLTGWYAVKALRIEDRGSRIEEETAVDPRSSILDPRSLVRFLWCWIGVYLVFFSLASTKLPNYVLPIYPAVAVLTAAFLDRWRRGEVEPPSWALSVSLASLALVGVATAAGLLLAGGVVEVPWVRVRRYPGLEMWSFLGLVPLLGAGAAWWCHRRGQRNGAVTAVALTAMVFLGILAGAGSTALERFKAPRTLAAALPAEQLQRDVRIACYGYFQPSLVFYCQRQVDRLQQEQEALEFLRSSLEVYLFAPAPVWQELETKVPRPYRLLARQRDLYTNKDVVVITNAEP
jgi:4-amino-4-deoxy-L-arabinose transferase-like glycosyltransferase